MGEVRVGVIGLRMGRVHAAAYHSLEQAELVAICDTNGQLVAEVTQQLGHPDTYTYAAELIALDLCRFIAGDIVTVSTIANHMSFLERLTDDCITAHLVFASGAIGRTLVSCGCKRKIATTLHICGTQGTIDHDRIVRAAGKPKSEWDFEPLAQPEIPDSITGESADFVRSIIEDRTPPVDVTDNLQNMAACFAVVESVARGGSRLRWPAGNNGG